MKRFLQLSFLFMVLTTSILYLNRDIQNSEYDNVWLAAEDAQPTELNGHSESRATSSFDENVVKDVRQQVKTMPKSAIVTYEDFVQENDNKSNEEITEQINELESRLDKHALIERANQNQLSADERVSFDKTLNELRNLRLLHLERNLDQLESELL